MKKTFLLGSHVASLFLGIGLGVYFLPVVIASHSRACAAEIAAQARAAPFHGEFVGDLKGSDFLHWGAGSVAVSQGAISLTGELSPGHDCKVYLSPEFVESNAEFEHIKPLMGRIGDVRTFHAFSVPCPVRSIRGRTPRWWSGTRRLPVHHVGAVSVSHRSIPRNAARVSCATTDSQAHPASIAS
jgi:hypothetical protein